ncbi:Trans-aconitate 2-methyltransferase [compost metagenome]
MNDPYQQTFQTWNKVASLYQENFMDLDLYNDTYDRFCKLIEKEGAKVFEIGCGPGNVTKYLLAKRPDLYVEGIDIAPNMIELAKKNNPTANFQVMDCREIDRLTDMFDAVMCGFCMPYLSKEDCAKLIKDCSNLLNPGGVLYFSVIEDEYSKSGCETNSLGDKMYIYYHEVPYLQDYLKENSFDQIEIERKEYVKAGELHSIHMIFIAKKK